MSLKQAMKLAQKQAFSKHKRKNTNSKFTSKKKNFSIKTNKKKNPNLL